MNVKIEREYGARHLHPSNLSQLKKQMTKQLTGLRTKSPAPIIGLFGSTAEAALRLLRSNR